MSKHEEVVPATESVEGGLTAPSYGSAKSNIAYMKTPANAMGALNTGMGYASNVDVATTATTMLMGGTAETIGYAAPVAP